MAQRMEQPLPDVTPSSSKKSSLWKRRTSKGKRYDSRQKSKNDNSSSTKTANKAAASPTTVAEAAMLTVTINDNNGIAAPISNDEVGDTVAVVSSSGERPAGTHNNIHHKSTYTMADDAVAYFPPSSNAAGSSQADSAASYFNSFISGHRLSFSEDEEDEEDVQDSGLIIQEVTQTSYEPEPFMDVDKGEKWTPFGTDLEPVDSIGLPNSPDEILNNDQQRNPPQRSQSEILFQNRQSEGINTTYHFNDGTTLPTPLTDPPSTHRKTLSPEFFLGSGSNNKNNTNLQKHQKKGRKRLDASTTHNTSMASHNNTSAATSMKENNYNVNNLSSNISNGSSSDGGNMYAEIYLPIKPKKNPYPPPSTMMGGVARDRSTLSSNTMPSLAITAVSSLSGRTSMFGTQSNGCCTENPIPTTADGVEMGNNHGGMKTYNYFDYDANAGSPLSPQGVSPERDVKPASVPSSNRSSRSSRKSNNDIWKTRLNNLWQSVAKHTCRCFGEPFSNEEERDKLKNQVSSATTAATSTTPANTMKGTPMFSTPIAGSWDG